MTDRPIRRAFSLSGTQPSLAAMPWWCSPAGLAFGFLLPVMGVIYLGGESGASGLTIRGVRYLNEHFLLLGALLIISLALPAWLGAQIQLSRTRQEPNYADWDVAVQFVAGIAVFAYLIWFKDIFFSPATLFGVLTGSVKLSRSEIGLTPGLTSLANMAPAFYSIYAYRLLKNASCRVPRALHIWFGVLLSLTLFRVYVWSERLALIELLIPFGLAMGWWVANRRSARFWSIVRVFGPFAALPFIILFFLVGIPHPVVWGVVMAIFSMLPVVGSNTVIVPFAVFLLITGHWGKALVLLTAGTGLLTISTSILKPKIVGDRAGLHPAVIVLSTIGGVAWLGMVGFFIGPLIAALFIMVWTQYSERYKARISHMRNDRP